MVETRIVDGPLPPIEETLAQLDAASARDQSGAQLIFHGQVRGTEGGRSITALDYEAYDGMAQAELQAIAQETARRFPIHHLLCLHRIGLVPVGEASLRVAIRSAHRAEALQALAHFIDRLKDRVPIWKWGLTAEWERFPSEHRDGDHNLGIEHP